VGLFCCIEDGTKRATPFKDASITPHPEDAENWQDKQYSSRAQEKLQETFQVVL
jgi:hypothetical protein